MSNHTKNSNTINERVHGVERDVVHLTDAVTSVRKDMLHGFNSLEKLVIDAIAVKKVPVGQWATVILVLMTLIGAILMPLNQTDVRITKNLEVLEQKQQDILLKTTKHLTRLEVYNDLRGFPKND